MRSFHVEIVDAEPVSAFLKEEGEGKKVVTIEYKAKIPGADRFYRGSMKVDLTTFIFEEISFDQISASQLRRIQTKVETAI